MNVWVPWDADEEEIEALFVVREPLPSTARPAVLAWLYSRLTQGYDFSSEAVVNEIQSAMRVNFNFERGGTPTPTLMAAVEEKGDRFILRVVDYLLSRYQAFGLDMPEQVIELQRHLELSSAGVEVVVDNFGGCRLGTRLPEGVEEAAQAAVNAAPKYAAKHLSTAWRSITDISPDPSKAMTESVKAVEAAAQAVLLPNDHKIRQSKLVEALKSQSGWQLTLAKRGDGHPDHKAVLIGMMETLFLAHSNRHSGDDPSLEEAQSHVMLASLLVGWFATGTVVKNP